VSTRATIGRIGIARTELATNQGFKNIIIKDITKVIPEYLAFILTAKKDEMTALASGATFKEISKANFCSIQIPIPTISEQKRIVDEILRYKQLINNAKEILRCYVPTISNRTFANYTALEDVAQFKPSKDEVKDLPPDTNVSFVPMADLNTFDAIFDTKDTRKISDVVTGFTYFKDEDVLLAKITPCFENGKAGIARNLVNGIGFGSTEYIVIRANTDLVYPEWIFYHINTPEFINGGKSFMTGTAGQQRVDLNYVKQYRIPVPPLEEQKTILDEIQTEQALVNPSHKLIEVFTAKIQNRIKEVLGE
jgi:restriction endonuclease S subunit